MAEHTITITFTPEQIASFSKAKSKLCFATGFQNRDYNVIAWAEGASRIPSQVRILTLVFSDFRNHDHNMERLLPNLRNEEKFRRRRLASPTTSSTSPLKCTVQA